MKITQNVSSDTLAWLPNCVVTQCLDGGRFNVSDDHENFISAYRQTGQFGVADSIAERYGVVIEPVIVDATHLTAHIPDPFLGAPTEQQGDAVDPAGIPNPRDGYDLRPLPKVSAFAAIADEIGVDASHVAQLQAMTAELKAITEKSSMLATRIVVMQRTANPKTRTAFMDTIRDKALQHRHIFDFGYDDNDVIAVTHPLVATIDDDIRYNLGQIEIRMNLRAFMSGIVEDVRFFNLTHVINSDDSDFPEGQAGHVSDNGDPCLGGWLVPLAQFAQDYNITAVIDQFIGFLTQPDPEDGMGCYILTFPRC